MRRSTGRVAVPRPLGASVPADRGSLSGGVAKNILGNVVGPLAGLASAPILAYSLGVEGRGEVAAATAPFLLITTLATLGIPEAATYFVAKHDAVFRVIRARAASILVLAGLLAMGIGVLAAPLVGGDDADLVQLIMLATLAIVPTVLLGLLRGVAAGLGMWSSVALERALGPVVRLVAVAALALFGVLDVATATFAIVGAPIVGGLVYLVRRSRIERGVRDTTVTRRSLINYGSRVWLGSVAGVLLMRIDQVLMAPLSSTFELGLYVVAVTISELPLVVNTAVREVMFAADARSTADDILTRAARISLFACFGIAAALGATAVWWLPLLFGPGFGAALSAVLVLLLAVVVGVPGSIAGSGLSARGLPQLRSLALVVACAANVAIVLIAVPALGALGAAIATLVGNLVSSNLNVLHMRRRFDIPFMSFYAVRISDLRVAWSLLAKLLRRR